MSHLAKLSSVLKVALSTTFIVLITSDLSWACKVEPPTPSSKGLATQAYTQHPFIQALTSCYQTNPALKAKQQEQAQQAEKVNQAAAGWFPNVTLGGSVSHQYNDALAENASNRKGTTYSSPRVASLTLNQSLFAGGATVAQTTQAEEAAFAGMADFFKTEQDTLVEAANAFLSLWLKDAVLSLRKKNVDLKTTTLNQVKARAAVGELTLTDVAQAEGEQAAALNSRIMAEAEFLNARATYVKVIGQEPPADLTPPRQLISRYIIPRSRHEMVQQALTNNPAIQKAIHESKAGDAGIDLARAAFMPTVDLNVQGQQALSASNPDSRARSAAITLELKFPLYRGGGDLSKFREARQAYSKSKTNLSSARLQIIEAASQVWEKWEAAKAQIEQTKVQIKAQALTLEGVRQEFMVGEKTTKDLLDQENKLVEAETSLVNAEQTYFLATFQILAMIGQMTARGLELPVEPYAIQAQYNTIRNKWLGFGDPPER